MMASGAVQFEDLEMLGEIGDYDYSWSVFGVWVSKDGRYFYDDDSGCSCYGPWEDVKTSDDLSHVTTFEAFSSALDEWLGREPDPQIGIEASNLRAKVRGLM